VQARPSTWIVQLAFAKNGGKLATQRSSTTPVVPRHATTARSRLPPSSPLKAAGVTSVLVHRRCHEQGVDYCSHRAGVPPEWLLTSFQYRTSSSLRGYDQTQWSRSGSTRSVHSQGGQSGGDAAWGWGRTSPRRSRSPAGTVARRHQYAGPTLTAKTSNADSSPFPPLRRGRSLWLQAGYGGTAPSALPRVPCSQGRRRSGLV
jgi:hypothetical protein